MAKSINLEICIWYEERSRHIKLSGKGLTASTVSNDSDSKRYHPNLFRKLSRALREAGAPASEAIERRGRRPQSEAISGTTAFAAKSSNPSVV